MTAFDGSEPETGKHTDAQTPDWLPDWTDKTQYPDPENTPGRVWVWEFLRRNSEYQKIWDEFASHSSGLIHKDFSHEGVRERLEKDFGVQFPAPPSLNTSDPDFQRRPRFTSRCKTWIKPVDWPDHADPYIVDAGVLDVGEAVVQFDLRWPLTDQLQSAKTFLQEQVQRLQQLGALDAPNSRMNDPADFRDYLRLLDAESAAVPRKQMSEVIYKVVDEYPDHKGQQKVSHNLKRAAWYRDKGYRLLAMTLQA
jgi:hypothetical protein